MAPSHDADRLAQLATELLAEPSETITTAKIVHRGKEMLREADHVSLTVRGRRHTYMTLGSTSDLATQCDDSQYSLREGPCVSGAEGLEWLRSGDIGRDRRWPRWGPAAASLGVGSVLSFCLRARDEPIGALNLYSDRRGAFVDPDEVELASLFTVHAAHALRAARLVTGLETALTSRHAIGMAQGVLMERYGLSADRAFAMLERLSSTHNVKLRDLAQDIVATREVPGVPDRGTP